MALSPEDVKQKILSSVNIDAIIEEIDRTIAETISTDGEVTTCKVWLNKIYPDYVMKKVVDEYRKAGWPSIEIEKTSNQRDGDSTLIVFTAHLYL